MASRNAKRAARQRRPAGRADGESRSPARPFPGWRSHLVPAVCGLLVLAVGVVFAQTVAHDFVNLDDEAYVYGNRHVLQGFSVAGSAWAVAGYHSSNWHPLTWLSHMLDCQIYGRQPWGHHLTNVLLHAAAAVVLFLTLRRMTGGIWPSACTAAVFALHPLRVESVAWVAERKDVLSGLLFMLTLWCYSRYVERPPSRGAYVWVVAVFALGLAAKPMLVTLPFVLLLLDYWPLGRMAAGSRERGAESGEQGARSREDRTDRSDQSGLEPSVPPDSRLPTPRDLLVEKIPLFALAAASCAVTLAAQRQALSSLQFLPFSVRAANALLACVGYLGEMIWPVGLAVHSHLLRPAPPPAWEVMAAAAALAAISAVVFLARRKCPYCIVGWLWYMGTLVPVIGLVQVGDQAMADRYTYLPQVGLYMALAWGGAGLVASKHDYRSALATVSTLLLAGLAVSAWRQASYWRNSETLWNRTLAESPENEAARNYLGVALTRDGRLNEAIEEFREAARINPHYAEARNNLGYALWRRGEIDQAIDQYREALRIDPGHARAHDNLGIALARRGRLKEAITEHRAALKADPELANAHSNLANALAVSERMEEAIAEYRQALKLAPDSAEIHVNLGVVLAGRGQFEEARAEYQAALDLASAGNKRALAEAIRGRMGRLPAAAPR